MEKRVVAGILVSIIIALVIVNSYALRPVEDNGGDEESALVSFHLDDSRVLNVTCEIADEPAERAMGLMSRRELALDKGMLFVYETPQNVTFWMKNTDIPLDMIFIGKDKTVLNVEEADVEPSDVPDSQLKRYHSSGPVKWVVEINQGLSEQNGIGAGTEVDIEYSE